MPQVPKYDLAKVKQIAEQYLAGKRDVVLFSAPSRSLHCVVEVLLCDDEEAPNHIATGILNLEPQAFCERVLQWDTTMDVYGLEDFQNIDWYVKFCLEEIEGELHLEQVSFHPLEKPMRLADGRLIQPRNV